MNLKLERYPEGVIGREGEVCFSCFGMGESGTKGTATQWAYNVDPIERRPLHFCDTCLIGLRDLLTKHIDEHHIVRRSR